jgi:hypothetical protein
MDLLANRPTKILFKRDGGLMVDIFAPSTLLAGSRINPQHGHQA